MELNKTYEGDVLQVLKTWPDSFIQTVVTSPPYWGLRDYGIKDQLGLEKTPEEYVKKMVEIFREVRRVLRPDGTVWLNLGDSYNAAGRDGHGTRDNCKQGTNRASANGVDNCRPSASGLKPKDLCMIPARVALALQADGWYLRSDIIWNKPNPMPESCTDRPTKAHEYIFLLTKSANYFYDLEAIREPISENANGKCAVRPSGDSRLRDKEHWGVQQKRDLVERKYERICGRNKRSVWEVATQPFSDWGYDFSSADYVGDDGNPYKVSVDCPVHGHLCGTKILKRGADGELPILSLRNKLNISKSLVQGLEGESSSKHSHGNQDSAKPNASLHESGSRALNKTSDVSNEAEPQNHHGIEGNEQTPVSNLDSPDRKCVETAISHNKRTHKKGHVPATNSPCNASEKIPSRTDGRLTSHGKGGQTSHNDESNISEDCVSNEKEISPSAQKTSHNGGTSYIYGNMAKCICQVSQLSHFATFPEKLIEPCILAGTSEKGCCEKCGAPWERQVKREFYGNWNPGPGSNGLLKVNDQKPERKGKFATETWEAPKTIGWQPTCKCKAGTKPCVVCDPFMGAGTTALVSCRFNRQFVGIELNGDYIKMSERRISQEKAQIKMNF